MAQDKSSVQENLAKTVAAIKSGFAASHNRTPYKQIEDTGDDQYSITPEEQAAVDEAKAKRDKQAKFEATNAAIKKELEAEGLTGTEPEPVDDQYSATEEELGAGEYNRVHALADDVMKGEYGNGDDRKEALGRDYDAVQDVINEQMSAQRGAQADAELGTADIEASASVEASLEAGD
jgi:hypothetical protein